MNLVQAVYLNNAVAPFDDQQVRQALCYAIDRQTIMDMIADGHGTALGSSIYPAFTKYFLPELVQKYPYDPAKAKELLAQAGYPNGFDMTITGPSNYQPHLDTAEVVAEQLRAVGVNVTIQPMEWGVWHEQVYKGRDFQATLVGLRFVVVLEGPAPQRPYHSTYVPFFWRRWWDFGGGTLNDMACHYMDLPFWALNLRHPTRVEAEGLNPQPCSGRQEILENIVNRYV